jgi:microcompartment protein CcmK/EutM
MAPKTGQRNKAPEPSGAGRPKDKAVAASAKKRHCSSVIKEINNKDWGRFCEKLNTLRHDSLLTIEAVQPDGSKKELARNVPLQNVKFEKTAGCSDMVFLEVGSAAGAERPMQHVITEPIHIRVKTADQQGAYNPVMIEAESGVTMLTFHPALRQDVFQDVQLA